MARPAECNARSGVARTIWRIDMKKKAKKRLPPLSQTMQFTCASCGEDNRVLPPYKTKLIRRPSK